jgi:hypothetical protein
VIVVHDAAAAVPIIVLLMMLLSQIQDEMNDFFDANAIPHNLRLRIRKYMIYKRDTPGSNMSDLLEHMSPAIRDEVALFKFQHILSSVAQFRRAPPPFLAAVALKLTTSNIYYIT